MAVLAAATLDRSVFPQAGPPRVRPGRVGRSVRFGSGGARAAGVVGAASAAARPSQRRQAGGSASRSRATKPARADRQADRRLCIGVSSRGGEQAMSLRSRHAEARARRAACRLSRDSTRLPRTDDTSADRPGLAGRRLGDSPDTANRIAPARRHRPRQIAEITPGSRDLAGVSGARSRGVSRREIARRSRGKIGRFAGRHRGVRGARSRGPNRTDRTDQARGCAVLAAPHERVRGVGREIGRLTVRALACSGRGGA